MDYHKEMARIAALTKSVAAGARRLTWDTARTVPDAIVRTTEARHQRMMTDSEPYRRNRADHPKVIAEILKEETADRRLAAGSARFAVEPMVKELDQSFRAFVGACRRDTGLSMPAALDRLDPAGMLTYHMLAETLRPVIGVASAADLLRRYARALETKDARGRIEAELIEERAEYGGLAATENDLSIVRQLNEYIAEVQNLRVPYSPEETRAIEDTIIAGRKAVSMADLAQVKPIDVTQAGNVAAKEAYDAEADAYAEAEAAEAAAAAGRQ
jgi:hypothetical protein